MKIKKGTLVQVKDSRSGNWKGRATKDFDTERDEWYPMIVAQDEPVEGINTDWLTGEEKPGRRGLCTIEPIKE